MVPRGPSLSLFILSPLDRLDDALLRFGGVTPVMDLRPLSRFQILVMGEEVLDLLHGDRRQIRVGSPRS